MRLANINGRLALVDPDRRTFADVAALSAGRFGPDPQSVYPIWDEFGAFVASLEWPDVADKAFTDPELGPPTPAPGQVFAIGLNYRDHAAESGFEAPATVPVVFTKFRSCLTGPYVEIQLPAGGHTDWEVELCVVMARRAAQVPAAEAWSHIAGLTIGQDLSERRLQMAADPPQFSLGKSYPGFGPLGPWLVTVDEFDNPDDLEVTCEINGEQVQGARTSSMIFPVPELVARLSTVVTLEPGDVIFTGTPSGVGMGREPQRWLTSRDELVSRIEGIGSLRQTFA